MKISSSRQKKQQLFFILFVFFLFSPPAIYLRTSQFEKQDSQSLHLHHFYFLFSLAALVQEKLLDPVSKWLLPNFRGGFEQNCAM